MGSPIAAASTGPPSFEFQTNIFYLDESRTIYELYTTDAKTWKAGDMGNVVVGPSSKLTSAWHRHEGCAACPNTLLLGYQDSESQLQIANGTSSGWQFDSLTTNALNGTSLSLTLSWSNDAWPTGLRLYYQIATDATNSGHLTSHDWRSQQEWATFAIDPSDVLAPDSNGWQNRESQPLPAIIPETPIASFTYGTAPNGLPILMDVLTSCTHGINSIPWTGAGGGDWASTVDPAAKKSVQNFSALAANADARVYGVVGGGASRIIEFQSDENGSELSVVGDVLTS